MDAKYVYTQQYAPAPRQRHGHGFSQKTDVMQGTCT